MSGRAALNLFAFGVSILDLKPKDPITVVCAILRDEDGKVLVARRPEGKSLAGKWEFPGGKVHEGEMLDQALKRELSEELGICATIGQQLPDAVHDYGSFAIRLIPFLVQIESGVPEAREHSALDWVPVSGLNKTDLAEADLPVASHLRNVFVL